jgi:alpha-tubulin suppressor-like RCC1 family protein
LRSHTCARRGDGSIWCWGANAEGQIGNGSRTDQPTPYEVPSLDAATPGIAAGWDHSCGLVSGGRVACWGEGGDGQLGDGTFVDRTTPAIVKTSSGAPLESVIAVVTGSHFSCALRSTGYAYCWGNNFVGQLGTGDTSGTSSPYARQVAAGGRIIALTAGFGHACALFDDGTARCWGENHSGELGTGAVLESATPLLVDDLDDAVSIAAGAYHTCAVRSYGYVVCWGSPVEGQLGYLVPSSPFGDRPIVEGISDAVEVVSGGWHSCALLSNGQVTCWGHNAAGELGDGTTTMRPTPIVTSLSYPTVQLAAGALHTCALLATGAVRCWGSNYHGQLGDGTSMNQRLLPVAVTTGMVTLSAGNRHTCGVRLDGTARCWGNNQYGQLGDGTTTDALSGTTVLSFP